MKSKDNTTIIVVSYKRQQIQFQNESKIIIVILLLLSYQIKWTNCLCNWILSILSCSLIYIVPSHDHRVVINNSLSSHADTDHQIYLHYRLVSERKSFYNQIFITVINKPKNAFQIKLLCSKLWTINFLFIQWSVIILIYAQSETKYCIIYIGDSFRS